jgi:uncharacterized protein YbaP (TraB family)
MQNSHRIFTTLSVFAALWLALLPNLVTAQEQLEEVLVSGEQPGPALWKVSKGDHTLWIVGTLAPLPTKMTWRSKQVEKIIQQSQEILGSSSVRADVKGGGFTLLRLLPSLLRLRNNADGATLRQMLPPDVHARWEAAYLKYFGKTPDKLERWRPMFVADALYEKALATSGLSNRAVVWPTIETLAKERKISVRQRKFQVPLPEPKALIAEIAATPRDKDIACLVATLDRIDQDLPNMKQRAAAWATGDLETLRALPYTDQQQTCIEAVINGPRLRKMFDDQKALVEADGFGAMGYMLLAHQTSLTAMPIQELLNDNGILAKLRATGYTVEAPQ